MREVLRASQDYRDIRSRLIQDALAESIQQALGAEVRRSLVFGAEQRDEQISEHLVERIVQRSRGRVSSYEIIGEEVAQQSDEQSRSLTIQLRAQVCLPAEDTLAPIVAFGTFRLADGSADERLRTLLMASAPRSERLDIISGPSEQHYHDIRIDGKVLDVRSFLLDNRREIELLRAYLGAQATATIPQQIKRVEVAVATEASFAPDQTVLVKATEVVRDLAVDADEGPAIIEMIEEAARRSAATLFATLTAPASGARTQGD